MPKTLDFATILAKNVQKTDTCWYWCGHVDELGYGRIGHKGKIYKAHRFVYSNLIGPIQPGLTIDHLCRIRHCVNPAHLEAVTNRENILRGNGPTAKNAKKVVCKWGHPLDRIRSDGNRRCGTCFRQQNKEYARRVRELAKFAQTFLGETYGR